MTVSEPRTGVEASDLGRFEPTPYDLGVTDDPEAAWADLTAPESRTERPGLLDVIAAFFGAEHQAGPGRVWIGPCDRTIEPEPEAEP